MKNTLIIGACLLFAQHIAIAQTSQYKPVEGKIMTEWAAQVTPENVHQEYPRPQMTRSTWVNLNGLWDYAIKAKGQVIPTSFDGEILVPFAVESALSGVGKTVGKDNELWYNTTFSTPKKSSKDKVLLHFGASDWETEVFVNGKSIGKHRGGYDPFDFDITNHLKSGKSQTLQVRVWDPSDEGPQPRGKQVNNPNGIWYTPVTGIWQTVWLETVPAAYISGLRNASDIKSKEIIVTPEIVGATAGQQVKVSAWKDGVMLAEQTVKPSETAKLAISDAQLWAPGNPVLYDLKVELVEGKKIVDAVGSYAALREISMATDENGIQRMMLNGEFLFQYGPLDQGWFPDGLYTAPSHEAMVFDIQKTQDMGFNMIRKHVKVEPATWYHACDKMGMLVWQDMPSGDMGNGWEMKLAVLGSQTDKDRTPESEAIFREEWKEIMDDFYNFPSIVVWVPFNEAWGQFKTKEIADWTKIHDSSRLVNSASGGNFEMDGSKIAGDIIDLHNYPDAKMPDPKIYGKDNILVLGEFGGLGLPVDGHVWQQKDNWGYQSFKNQEELYARYEGLITRLGELVEAGLSAAVYTQTTDVEVETNGLMTYDRKVIKFDVSKMKSIHSPLYKK
ncbi:glycoside hydrolase family 2 protein [Algoriphagus aquimarinus]|uniref:Glycosyl hydrolases family 2 n=1 Tax=Algoriphagus aquimarinus TaxID=237018 RepID=A0A1I0W0D6_9BACT|nr:sugar-binding domain-containing protein [Algoriphagus aquimarinus]SFA81386.1 Glycosyl hydrolases family 2 [Algoriphagus aquimarinus]